MEEKIQFPQYRKYSHGRTLFKIESLEKFQELQIIGSSYSLMEIQAKQLPEFNLIRDMLSLYQGHWEKSSAEEFEQNLRHCEGHLKKLG